jgi:malonyl-CoA/methylmalonyl-CoA synthetase
VGIRDAGASIGEADVLKGLKDRLAKFKLPKRVHFVDELPRNAIGKGAEK